MTKVNRNTYANCLRLSVEQYEGIHGLIEEFGGRVKQFTQDIRDPNQWYIFYEMAKIQRTEFSQAILEYFDKNKTPK